MEPKTFSATALHVAELCTARYKAEFIERGKGQSNSAATLGSSVHGALEMYVKNCVMESKFPATVKQLLDFFKMSYMKEFDTVELSGEDYEDGVEMLQRWHKRTSWDGVTVLSVEVKTNFPIQTSIGDIPFNYIWDRFDKVGEREYKVVDYKTNRWGINPQDLRKKVQARAYALAAAIQLKKEGKEVDRIWVEFDMLRHDGPVGIVFSRDENAAMWRWLKEKAQYIVDLPDDEVQETINAECNFCPRKVSCKALQRNLAIGGIASIGSAAEAVDIRTIMALQKKAIESAIKEIDEIVLTEARLNDVFEFESDTNRLRVGVSSRRAVDADRVGMVIGPQLMDKYGGKSFTITNLNKLLKGDEITEEQKSQLKGLIYSNTGEPRVTVEVKGFLEEES
jgi:RecB family exonuclease